MPVKTDLQSPFLHLNLLYTYTNDSMWPTVLITVTFQIKKTRPKGKRLKNRKYLRIDFFKLSSFLQKLINCQKKYICSFDTNLYIVKTRLIYCWTEQIATLKIFRKIACKICNISGLKKYKNNRFRENCLDLKICLNTLFNWIKWQSICMANYYEGEVCGTIFVEVVPAYSNDIQAPSSNEMA